MATVQPAPDDHEHDEEPTLWERLTEVERTWTRIEATAARIDEVNR